MEKQQQYEYVNTPAGAPTGLVERHHPNTNSSNNNNNYHDIHTRTPEPFLQKYLGNPKYLLPLIGAIFLLAGHFNGFLSKRADVDLTNAIEVFKPHSPPALTIDERTDRILSSVPLIDTHIDLPILARALYQNHINAPNFTVPFKTGGLYGQIDIPRLKTSKLGGVFWLFYEVGVRYITLTHNCNNLYADGAIVPAPHWNGLNPKLGPGLIREFNRLGMIIDLSHVSAATMRDVLSISVSPIIFSHSSSFSLTPHPRNVPDDVLQLVKKNGGVVQVNFVPDFVTQSGDGKASLEDVADHVVYIAEKVGWEHVGFGSDYDGSAVMPDGLEDVSKYPQLIKELLRRGVKDEDVKKAAGGNVLRVWREVERIAEKLQKEGEKELEDEVEKMKFEL
ncbi:hypothetical protein TWF192_006006 [Orbilia oligospora]|uniref:Dipeptidase n=1 Tax=Orbilia oligospora TaxID=2813651 RepID=A0A6G1M7X1_ORBOL|nr:hypothetical protein TWF191_009489 [Orbilia oligospora]KAF3249058.1 hypothetical protein TWF192_006006 [Orbilia oligospora]